MMRMHKHHRVAAIPKKRFIDRAIFIVAAVQPLGTIPQILTVFRTHDGSSLSISSWAIYIIFDIAWLWYGIVEKQKAVIVSAVLFSLLEGMVLVGAVMYGGTL
jgi:uncharacterized protein with PQ loop repeat